VKYRLKAPLDFARRRNQLVVVGRQMVEHLRGGIYGLEQTRVEQRLDVLREAHKADQPRALLFLKDTQHRHHELAFVADPFEQNALRRE